MINIVFARGRIEYGVRSGSFSSFPGKENLNLRVPSRPVVVVAAYLTLFFSHKGIRKVDVHPAPRMRMSTLDFDDAGLGWVCEVVNL